MFGGCWVFVPLKYQTHCQSKYVFKMILILILTLIEKQKQQEQQQKVLDGPVAVKSDSFQSFV